MPSIINADNGVASGSVGLKYSSDNSGVLALQSNNNTIISASNTLTTISSTNVGIGTNSASYKLTVNGTVYAYNASATFLSQDASGGAWFGNAQAGDYAITESGVAERLRIKASTGNVLVGTTTNNGAKLVVSSGGTNTPSTSGNMTSGYVFQVGDGSQALNFGNDATGVWYNAAFANNAGVPLAHRWQTGATERMRITSTGSVGIGTTSPSYSLDVVGTVRGTTGLISGAYRTVNLTGNYSNGTWYSIGDTTNLVQGTWLVNAYVDTYAAGSAIYFMMYSSVPFYIQATSSNNADTFAIPQMIGSGHSPNGVLPPSLRIRQSFQGSSDAGKIFVEFNPNANWSGLDGTGGKTVIFTFKRLTE